MPCCFVLCCVLGYEFRRLVSLVFCYLNCFRIRIPEVHKPCLLFDCLWVRYHLMPQDLDMIDARWIIATVFKDLYLFRLREIRL